MIFFLERSCAEKTRSHLVQPWPISERELHQISGSSSSADLWLLTIGQVLQAKLSHKYIHLTFRLIQCDSLHEQCWELLAEGSWKKPSCTLSARPSWTLRKSWKVKVGSRWSGNCCQKKEVWCDAEMSWCQIKVFSTSPQSACTRPSKLAKTKVNGLFSNLELN